VLSYLRKHFVAAEFKIDLFHMFLQRGVSLLRDAAHLGYIVPTSVLNNVYAESLRDWLMDRCCIEHISIARDRVFAMADVYTCVLILGREPDAAKRSGHEVLATSALSEPFVGRPTGYSPIRQCRFYDLPGKVWNVLVNEENGALVARLAQRFTPLNKIATVNRGLITGDRDSFFSTCKASPAHVPIIAGRDVERYSVVPPSQYVLFQRPDTAGGCWDADVHFAGHKVVVRQICRKPTAAVVREPLAVTGNIFTIRASSIEEELYLLGLINSRLMEFFWSVMFTDFKTSFPQVTVFSLSQLPIRTIDFSDPADKARHGRVVETVEQMLALHKQLAAAKTDHEKTALQRQIDATDRQIDRVVYELYGLTEEEIAIVERQDSH
jgi:hypothetical protein